MADFLKAYNAVIVPFEGGYASAATAASIGDTGGETYKGVSRNNNPTWKGWQIIDAYKAKYGEPKYNSYIKSTELDQAVSDLYKTNYWNKNRLGEVVQQPIANLLMDITVNSGPGTAAKSIQRVLGIPADGIIGNQTIAAINNANPFTLLTALVNYRLEWLKTNLSDAKFLQTLLNRTSSYLKGAADIVRANKTIAIPVFIAALIGGGYLLYRYHND